MLTTNSGRSMRTYDDKAWIDDCRVILSNMFANPDSTPFREPVDESELPVTNDTCSFRLKLIYLHSSHTIPYLPYPIPYLSSQLTFPHSSPQTCVISHHLKSQHVTFHHLPKVPHLTLTHIRLTHITSHHKTPQTLYTQYHINKSSYNFTVCTCQPINTCHILRHHTSSHHIIAEYIISCHIIPNIKTSHVYILFNLMYITSNNITSNHIILVS